jgi:hypothetical protein
LFSTNDGTLFLTIELDVVANVQTICFQQGNRLKIQYLDLDIVVGVVVAVVVVGIVVL